MFHVACVEDSPEEFASLSQEILQFGKEASIDFKITHFSNAERFLESFSCQYEIIFLDIALPEMSGMELAAAIRKSDNNVPIIFVTSLAQFALNGYSVGAFDFVVKPLAHGDFAFKMKRLMNHMATTHVAKIVISSSSRRIALASNEIYYVEIIGHTIIYHTSKGNFETYDTMRNVEAQLTGYNFAKCNACYLVNLAFVETVQGYDLTVHDEIITISHPRKKEFMAALNDFYGKRTH
ncbi:MAG: LytTR family DNA-binding domain-containing protein [Bacilli bacterium]|nr:LytTR family DNA-binding domain-containing protein [Bacilli bacterium]